MAIDDDDFGGEDTSNFPMTTEYPEAILAKIATYVLIPFIDNGIESDEQREFSIEYATRAIKDVSVEGYNVKKLLTEDNYDKIIDIMVQSDLLRNSLKEILDLMQATAN